MSDVSFGEYRERIRALEDERDRLREAIRPFANEEFCRILGGNVNGDDSIVFQRNDSPLTIGDFKRARAALQEADDE